MKYLLLFFIMLSSQAIALTSEELDLFFDCLQDAKTQADTNACYTLHDMESIDD